MEADVMLGFFFIVLGAVCGGSFGLPSKFAGRNTPWETLWGPFFFFATVMIPVVLGPLMVEGLFRTCSAADIAMLAGPLVFGLLWGLGSMTLGLSFAFIGLSLAYALNYAAQISFGTMSTMLVHNPEDALVPHGYVIIGGVVICLFGVVVIGRAGVLKTRSMKGEDSESTTSRQPAIVKGMSLAFISGILCGCYALAFSFGGDVQEIAVKKFNNPEWVSTFVVTALILWGGSLSSCIYCGYKLTVNRTWNTLAAPGIGKVLLIAFVMAVLHDGAILFWGLGASKLGELGVAVGYAIFMSLSIIVGNLHGFITKEWKGASRESITFIVAGIVVLILGVGVLLKGNVMKIEAGKNVQQNESRINGDQ